MTAWSDTDIGKGTQLPTSDAPDALLSQIVVVLSGSMEPGYYRGDILFLNQPKAALNPGDIVVFDTGVRDVPIVHRIIKLHQRAGNASSIDILTKVRVEMGGEAITAPCVQRDMAWIVGVLDCTAARGHRGMACDRTPGSSRVHASSAYSAPLGGAASAPQPPPATPSRKPRPQPPPATSPANPARNPRPKTPQGDNNWGDDRSLYPPGMRWLHREHIMGRVAGSLPHIGRLTIVMNDYPLIKVLLILGLGVFVLTSKE